MRLKNLCKITFTALVLAFTMSLTAFAGTWQQDDKGWWYQEDTGSYPKSAWQWIDGNNDGTSQCYYFDDKGYLLTNTTTSDGYTVNQDGAWVLNGQIQTQTFGLGSDAKNLLDAATAKTSKLTSMAGKSKIDMTITLGSESIPATVEMDIKLKDLYSNNMKYLATTKTSMFGTEINGTLFYVDGYYYMDMAGTKYKVPMNLDTITQSVMDNTNTYEMNTAFISNATVTEGANGQKLIQVNYDTGALMDYANQLAGSMNLGSLGSDLRFTGLDGVITISSDGYVLAQDLNATMVMKVENQNCSVTMKMKMDYINPGQPVDFVLPSTEGYSLMQ